MNNMTQGNPWKVILRFMAPVLLGNLIQLSYILTDTYGCIDVCLRCDGADARYILWTELWGRKIYPDTVRNESWYDYYLQLVCGCFCDCLSAGSDIDRVHYREPRSGHDTGSFRISESGLYIIFPCCTYFCPQEFTAGNW